MHAVAILLGGSDTSQATNFLMCELLRNDWKVFTIGHPIALDLLNNGRFDYNHIKNEKTAVIVDDIRTAQKLDIGLDFEKKGYFVTSINLQRTGDESLKCCDEFKYTVSYDNEADRDVVLYSILEGCELLKPPRPLLEDIVYIFNASYKKWSKDTRYGANFDFRYNEDGIKELSIRDCEKIATLPEDKKAQRVKEVEGVMHEFGISDTGGSGELQGGAPKEN